MNGEVIIVFILILITIILITLIIFYEKGYKAGERKMRDVYLVKNHIPCEYRLTPLHTPYYNLERLRWNDENSTQYIVIAEGVTEEEAEDIIKNLSRAVIEIGGDND